MTTIAFAQAEAHRLPLSADQLLRSRPLLTELLAVRNRVNTALFDLLPLTDAQERDLKRFNIFELVEEHEYFGRMAAAFYTGCGKPAFVNTPDYFKLRQVTHAFALRAREPEGWRYSKNGLPPVEDFLHYLFTQYPTPVFLTRLWLSGREEAFWWLMHAGRGGSWRTLPSPPFALDRRLAHALATVPDDIPFSVAITYALFCSRDVNPDDALQLAREAHDRYHHQFIFAYANWASSLLQETKVNGQLILMMDYLYIKWCDQPGSRVQQPEYYLKQITGEKSPRTLLRDAPALMAQITKFWGRNSPLPWKGFGCGQPVVTTAREKFLFTEINSHHGLTAESARMNNCVRSYSSSCEKGTTSIWKMTNAAGESVLNIELRSGLVISEVRGRSNRRAVPSETDVVRNWADVNGFTIAPNAF